MPITEKNRLAAAPRGLPYRLVAACADGVVLTEAAVAPSARDRRNDRVGAPEVRRNAVVEHGAPWVSTGRIMQRRFWLSTPFLALGLHFRLLVATTHEARHSWADHSLQGKRVSATKLLHLRLVELRSAAKLTQKELAKMIGSKGRTIGHWESGKTEPGASHIARLCEVFDVSFDYLCGRSDARSGIAPDSWIVDLDAYEHAIEEKTWASKVPRRMRIVTFAEYDRMRQDLAKRVKERTSRGNSGSSK